MTCSAPPKSGDFGYLPAVWRLIPQLTGGRYDAGASTVTKKEDSAKILTTDDADGTDIYE
jgi:hypothetical protein